jgi:aspartyl aminopeptidase
MLQTISQKEEASVSLTLLSMSKQSVVSDLLGFINASPSPFHAVAASAKLLDQAGFTELKESSSFTNSLYPSGKYFYTRNQSAIVAFAIGNKYKRGNGFSIIGAHTDSPCLKVKPCSKREAAGCVQVGVEVYGGGLWHTWFDRDLGLAGRVFVETTKGHFESRLVRIHRSNRTI